MLRIGKMGLITFFLVVFVAKITASVLHIGQGLGDYISDYFGALVLAFADLFYPCVVSVLELCEFLLDFIRIFCFLLEETLVVGDSVRGEKLVYQRGRIPFELMDVQFHPSHIDILTARFFFPPVSDLLRCQAGMSHCKSALQAEAQIIKET